MRGFVARAFALIQVIVTDVLFTVITLGLNLFAMWLTADVQTREAFIFAPFLVAASLLLAGKGADLLHRKWSEYEAMETERQGLNLPTDMIWINPMLEVAKMSRTIMAVCDVGTVAMIAPVTLWLSLNMLASNFPSYHKPVMILSLIGCVVGLASWVLAPGANVGAGDPQ